MKRIILILVGISLVLLVVIQFIPVSHNNPAVTREVNWDTQQTHELAKRACFDCHSNETVWPWYSNVAPVSLILSNHVREGREGLNFSQWDRPNSEFDEVEEVIKRGEMPLWDYLLMHPEAKLTSAESDQLVNGLRTTFQQDPPIIRERENRGREDD